MTLIELLVVISMIGFLIALLIPSLKRSVNLASSTICQHNLKQLGTSLLMYTTENDGWLPVTKVVESAAASAEPESPSWFAMLFPTYMPDPMLMRCPSDPFGNRMEQYRDNIDDPEAANAVSYGLNQFIMTAGGGYLANVERRHPKRPAQTILVADLGPDDMRYEERTRETSGPGRNGSLVAWGGGWDPYSDTPKSSWLTRRHGHGIHVLALDSSVHDVASDRILRSPVKRFYANCKAGGCALCNELSTPHYSFAKDHLYWWTGTIPAE
jgi:type II secretory pathway pseudopilin PulG